MDDVMTNFASAVRYANGSYHPEFIHFTQREAQALLEALDKLSEQKIEHQEESK